MKTLRLNRAESGAYTNGKRRIWRAMRKQPRVGLHGDGLTERGEKCHEYHGSRATHARNAKSQS